MQISPARAEERPAALRLFFQQLQGEDREARVQRALGFLKDGELSPDGLLVCRTADGLVGVIAAQSMAGAAGLLWPPQAIDGPAQKYIEDALVRAASRWLRQHGGKFAQVLLPAADNAAALLRNGFANTTTLVYLQKTLEQRDYLTPLSAKLWCQPYTECDKTTFNQILLNTYDQTLDCPELNGLRTADEIAAGYQAVPGCRLDRWWLAWHQERPVGVLITVAAPDQTTWELLYVGLAPAARRQGLGAELTRKAMAEALAAGGTRLILTVDGRNPPALQMYRALGFDETDRMQVYLSIFLPAEAPIQNSRLR